ncbi:MAG: hypothetical protein IPH00_01155 [Flavobacteriales bacterium]|nr:hypothetical protein [Flavobacteriales bacterium]
MRSPISGIPLGLPGHMLDDRQGERGELLIAFKIQGAHFLPREVAHLAGHHQRHKDHRQIESELPPSWKAVVEKEDHAAQDQRHEQLMPVSKEHQIKGIDDQGRRIGPTRPSLAPGCEVASIPARELDGPTQEQRQADQFIAKAMNAGPGIFRMAGVLVNG